MKDLLDVTAEMKAHELAVDDIYQQVAQGTEIVSVILKLVWNSPP